MHHDTVLVTGASSGIGRELAKCFAAEGCRMILAARNTAALEDLATLLRRNYQVEVRVLAADLAQLETPQRLFDELRAAGLDVDVLVNNAGFGAHGAFAGLSLVRQLEMIQVNVAALTQLTGLFLPGIKQRGRGGVLNVASTAAFQPGPGMAVYYATKAYVLSFSEALGAELAGTGVTVTTLCPGPTADTNFGRVAEFKGPDVLTRGALSAAAVARYGHRFFRRGRLLAIPGWRNRILTLAVKFLPRCLIRRAVKKVNDLRA
jgi:uncharacterized protein